MEKRWPKAVDKGLRELAEEQPDNFQFERSMARVHQQVEEQRRPPLMRKSTIALIPSGVFVLLLAALLLIPATYTVTVGSVVEITVPNAGLELAQSLMGVAEEDSDLDRMNIMMTPDGLKIQFASSNTNPSELKSAALAALDTKLAGLDYDVDARPVTVERGGNALAALTGGTININTEGMSDAQIEQAITEALLGVGASAVDVDVQTSADGTQREVRIEMEADAEPGSEPGEFRVILDDQEPEGENVERHIEWIQEDE